MMRTAARGALVALVVVALGGACRAVPAPVETAAAVVQIPVASASAPPVVRAEPLEGPASLSPFVVGQCNLVVLPEHVYWLEIRSGRSSQRLPAKKGSSGAALTCAGAAGALVRSSRLTGGREEVMTFRYRADDLTALGTSLYWVGAPCWSRAKSSHDPDWLWSLDTTSNSSPAILGDLDRHYLGPVTSADAFFISDRFGKGGAYRFTSSTQRGDRVLPESESPWLVAAADRTLYWTDRAQTLYRTTLGTTEKVRLASIDALPMEGHVLPEHLLIRSIESLLLVPREGGEPRKLAAMSRSGQGAFDGRRFYYWAEYATTLHRMDVMTGESMSVEVPGGGQVCAVALDGDELYYADRKSEAVSRWSTAAFKPVRAAPNAP